MQLCFFQEDSPSSLLPIYIYIFSLKVNWAFISLYLYFRNNLDVVWNSRLCLCFSLLFRNVWERKINEELSELNSWNYNTEERVVLANIMEVFEGSIPDIHVELICPYLFGNTNSCRQFNTTKIQNSTWQYCSIFFFSSRIYSQNKEKMEVFSTNLLNFHDFSMAEL